MKDFASVVTALWARLNLGEPRFTEAGRIQLRIDGIGIDLTDNGRGLLVVEADVGGLSPDPAQRARQTRRVLETNLGFVSLGEAAVYLRTRPNGDKALAGRATYAYRRTSLDGLVKLIEDVLQIVEYYRAELRTISGSRTRNPARSGSDPVDTAMIFRP